MAVRWVSCCVINRWAVEIGSTGLSKYKSRLNYMGYEIRSESLLKKNSPEKDLGRDFLLPLTRKKRR